MTGGDEFDLLFDLTSDPVVILDAEGTLLRANPAFQSIAELIPATSLVDLIIRERDVVRFGDFLKRLAGGEIDDSASIVTEIGAASSGENEASPVIIVWRGGVRAGLIHLIGRVEAAAPREGAVELDPLLKAVQTWLPVPNSDEDADDLIRSLGEGLGWEAASLWLPTADDNYLCCTGFWGLGDLGTGDFAMATREMRFERGLGLIGRVWQSRREEWLDDVTTLSDYVRIGPARREHLRSVFVAPFDHGGRCAGVLEFYSRRVLNQEAADLNRIRRIAREVGRVLGSAG